MHETKKAFLEMGARLGEEVPMRRGSLSERYVKCSKPGCGCANDPKRSYSPVGFRRADLASRMAPR